MLRSLRSKLTFANVAATLALFLALTGGTAVALQGINTVNSGDVIPNSLRGSDIRNGGIGPQDLSPATPRVSGDVVFVDETGVGEPSVEEISVGSWGKLTFTCPSDQGYGQSNSSPPPPEADFSGTPVRGWGEPAAYGGDVVWSSQGGILTTAHIVRGGGLAPALGPAAPVMGKGHGIRAPPA